MSFDQVALLVFILIFFIAVAYGAGMKRGRDDAKSGRPEPKDNHLDGEW